MAREFLKQVSLFQNLSEEDFEMICAEVVTRRQDAVRARPRAA